MKDKELIRKIRDKDREALGAIIEQYYTDIFRFCLYMVQAEADAYDLTQEVFLKFIKYGASYQHKNLKGYLLTIARNLCFNYFQKKKEINYPYDSETLDSMLLSMPHESNELNKAEDVVYLMNLLRELSPNTRETVILRIYEELKFKDIAKIMGCSISTVKSRFRLGTQQLKKLMEEDYGK